MRRRPLMQRYGALARKVTLIVELPKGCEPSDLVIVNKKAQGTLGLKPIVPFTVKKEGTK